MADLMKQPRQEAGKLIRTLKLTPMSAGEERIMRISCASCIIY